MEISIKYTYWTNIVVENIEHKDKRTTFIKLEKVFFYYIVCKVMRKIFSNCNPKTISKNRV